MMEIPPLENPAVGQFLRALEDGWVEYLSPTGRKLYQNGETMETSFKPPRRVKIVEPPIATATWSLPASPDSNVGNILRKGTLKIEKMLRYEKSKKKKWHKHVTVLTDSFFIFKRHKKIHEADKIDLSNATVRLEKKKKNRYSLASPRMTISFQSDDTLEGEIWYHAILTIIENLQKPDKERPKGILSNRSNVGGFLYEDINLKKSSIRRSFSEKVRQKFAIDSDAKRKSLPAVRSSSIESENSFAMRSSMHSLMDILQTIPEENDDEMKKDELSGDWKAVEYKLPTPSGWTAIFDPNRQRFVYENKEANQTWSAARRPDGVIIFYHTESSRISWLLPSTEALQDDTLAYKVTEV